MNKLAIVLILLICLPTVFAVDSNVCKRTDGVWVKCTKGFIDLSKQKPVPENPKQILTHQLKAFIKEWAIYDDELINIWTVLSQVDENIEYKYYSRARGVDVTWRTKQGDCTDKAMVKLELLDIMKVKNRPVYGWSISGKHDWIEFEYNNTWYQDSNGDMIVEQKGYGRW